VSPTFLAQAVWSIDLDALLRRGLRGLVLDLDNTLVDWNQRWVRPQVREWIQAAHHRRLRMCILSNALRARRVLAVAQDLGIGAVVASGKPFPRAFRRALALLDLPPEAACAVGDQIFTDIVGARWAGLTTILVPPLSPRESPHTRLIRLLELPLRRRWARRALAIDRVPAPPSHP